MKIVRPKNIPVFLGSVRSLVREISVSNWCVYFLLKNDMPIYVGISQNLGERLAAHKKTKQFDRVLFIETESYEKSINLENSLILYLKPALNIRGAGDIPPWEKRARSVRDLMVHFGLIEARSRQKSKRENDFTQYEWKKIEAAWMHVDKEERVNE